MKSINRGLGRDYFRLVEDNTMSSPAEVERVKIGDVMAFGPSIGEHCKDIKITAYLDLSEISQKTAYELIDAMDPSERKKLLQYLVEKLTEA